MATNSNEREAVFCSGCNIWADKYKLELSLVLITVHASPDSCSSQASRQRRRVTWSSTKATRGDTTNTIDH